MKIKIMFKQSYAFLCAVNDNPKRHRRLKWETILTRKSRVVLFKDVCAIQANIEDDNAHVEK